MSLNKVNSISFWKQLINNIIEKQYDSGFSQHAEKAIRARKERARLRGTVHNSSRERLEKPIGGSDLERLNKYHWIPALSPSKMRELYRSSAAGMLNLELLDDIGVQFYLRCLQGVEEYQLIRTDQLKCHQCGTILPKEDGLMICSCGYQYTFQEYVRSFNYQRMPGGSALHVFQDYVEKWPGCRSDTKKMLLIDWMIHQCPISMSSGLPLRARLKNLIDAPQKQLKNSYLNRPTTKGAVCNIFTPRLSYI